MMQDISILPFKVTLSLKEFLNTLLYSSDLNSPMKVICYM